MSSLLSYFPDASVAIFFRLVAIFVVALVLNRLLRLVTNLLVKPAGSEARAAKAREQQTRTVAVVLYSAGSKIVWGVALLTAAAQFGINVLPAATIAGLASLALGFGAQNLVRDIITGFYIIREDQFVVGETIQVGDTIGRVEHVTLRRTVVRDARGALVTLSKRRDPHRGQPQPRLVASLRRRGSFAATFAGKSFAGAGSRGSGIAR